MTVGRGLRQLALAYSHARAGDYRQTSWPLTHTTTPLPP